MITSTVDPLRHEVSGNALPEDRWHVGPLLGNDELKLVLDARGSMHDFDSQPAWPPPRIVWTGRRHNQRIDRYNSNQFEYGFLDVRLLDESRLPPVTSWRQRLHPTEGWVETVIERAGGMQERAVTFLCLGRNLIVFHRRYTGLAEGIRPKAEAVYTFCQIGTDTIPFRTTWSPRSPSESGIEAEFTADGHRVYRGRAALFSDRPCKARAVANRLELQVPLDAEGGVTVFLALEDDLGDDPQLMTVFEGDWMPAGVREVHRENERRARERKVPDPAAEIEQTRARAISAGLEGLLGHQKAQWERYFSHYRVTLPASEALLAAAVRGAIYHVRCGYSHYDWGSSPFNQSWGAHYAWNERYPTEGLLAWGVTDMPSRVMEWRRRTLPFLSMRAAARGAFYHHSAVEPGTMTSERNATNFYEMFVHGIIADYIYKHYRYQDDDAILRRFYPVIRECAEFYRYWILVELPGNNIMTVPLIDVNESIYPVQDGPFTICSAARLFDLAVRAAERLKEDAAMLPTWRRYRDMCILLVRHVLAAKLPAVACYQDLELDSVPDPDMQVDTAVRDWRDQYKAAHAGFDQMRSGGGNVAGDRSKPRNWPWGAFQQVYLHATLGNPAQVREAIERGLRVLLPFGGQCESAEEDFSRIDHPWFTTASGALLRGVARMCLVPSDDDIRLLPGIPESWKELSFELPAHGALWVAAALREGRLVQLDVRAARPRPGRCVRVHVPAWALPDLSVVAPRVSASADPDGHVVLSFTPGQPEHLLRAEVAP